MAVYTKINKVDISYINRKFEIEKITTFKALSLNVADLFDRVVYWDRCL